MALAAEQHTQLATAYEKAATDWLVLLRQQAVFARKAHWFRLIARLAEKNARVANMKTPLQRGTPDGTPAHAAEQRSRFWKAGGKKERGPIGKGSNGGTP